MNKILSKDFITTKWSGGTTSQIYISPKNSNVNDRNFDYRVSSATCDLDETTYSNYDGYMRYLTPLDSEFEIYNGNCLIFLKPYDIYYFSGNDDIKCRGKGRDFNLIIKNDIKGAMYFIEITEDTEIICKSKKMILFNYNFDMKFKYESEEEIFEKFSAIELNENEKINLSGNGKIIISEIK